jgi:iron complex outermembrane receptor protein
MVLRFRCLVFGFAIFAPAVFAQRASTGVLRGTVRLEGSTEPVHDATVRIVNTNRNVTTNMEGDYEIRDLAPGRYEVVAHMHAFSDTRKTVTISEDSITELNFELKLSPIHEEVTVTASGHEESTIDSFLSVTSANRLDLTSRVGTSLGDVLETETGVTKRSSGPGTGRPVVRGFDGDRVAIMQDGLPTGTLSYQSGDHAEPMDVTAMERIEVVRGPATLLYGSNAIGGVVNAISAHHEYHQHPHQGVRGHITGTGGSNNDLAGGSGSFEVGVKNWLLWGGGGAQRTDDYSTPLGVVENSGTRTNTANGGVGYQGSRYFSTIGYNFSNGRYGVPNAPEEEDGHEAEEEHAHENVMLDFRRHNVRYTGGIRQLGPAIDLLTFQVNYSDWMHQEVADGAIENEFFNKQVVYRGVFSQRQAGRLSGSFGFQGSYRDYEAVGAEAITPPVKQNTAAVFGLEEFRFEKFKIQLGGRVERTAYHPTAAQTRTFTGFSGAAGVQVPLWTGGVFVTNYSHSFRAPALEELYAFGPHAGNLTFEIGDQTLRRERGDGLDFSLRHHNGRVRGELNYFHYWLSDFVFLAPTGNIEDGLIEAEYAQSDALYRGVEGRLDMTLHPNLWLNLGFDQVNAELRPAGTPLPRIPPVRGRIGVDVRWRGLSVRPGVVLANDQTRLFPTETRTAGYTTFNLTSSYTIAGRHTIQNFGVNAFNLGDRLYRNHLSFIKEFAPEIGRGVRFFYSVQFF